MGLRTLFIINAKVKDSSQNVSYACISPRLTNETTTWVIDNIVLLPSYFSQKNRKPRNETKDGFTNQVYKNSYILVAIESQPISVKIGLLR